MLDFIINLNELSLVILTILLVGLLTGTYRINQHLIQYAPPETTWAVTETINTLGKYLVIGGGLATLPVVVALIFSPDIESAFLVFLGVAGYLALIVAIPVLITTLCWRTCLSELTIKTVLLATFKAVKNALNWKTVGLYLIAAILFVLVWPVIKALIYLSLMILVSYLGFLGGEENESEGYNDCYHYSDDDDLDINNKTEEENYQDEVSLGFH